MAGPNIYDQIINGSFDAVGAGPSYISPPYRAEDYASIFATPPSFSGASSVGSPYLTADERRQLERQVAASKSLQAPYIAPPMVASAPSWNTPNAMDLAAIDRWNAAHSPMAPEPMLAYGNVGSTSPAAAAATAMAKPTTSVTAALKPSSQGGLLDLLFGASPGATNAGGLIGLLAPPAKPRTATPKATPQRYQQAGRDSNGDKLGSFEKDAYGNPGWMFS